MRYTESVTFEYLYYNCDLELVRDLGNNEEVWRMPEYLENGVEYKYYHVAHSWGEAFVSSLDKIDAQRLIEEHDQPALPDVTFQSGKSEVKICGCKMCKGSKNRRSVWRENNRKVRKQTKQALNQLSDYSEFDKVIVGGGYIA